MDGFELLSFSSFLLANSIEEVLDFMIENFSDKNNWISWDLFFYFFDGFYWGMFKFYKSIEENQNNVSWRLNYLDLEDMSSIIFLKQEFLTPAEIKD